MQQNSVWITTDRLFENNMLRDLTSSKDKKKSYFSTLFVELVVILSLKNSPHTRLQAKNQYCELQANVSVMYSVSTIFRTGISHITTCMYFHFLQTFWLVLSYRPTIRARRLFDIGSVFNWRILGCIKTHPWHPYLFPSWYTKRHSFIEAEQPTIMSPPHMASGECIVILDPIPCIKQCWTQCEFSVKIFLFSALCGRAN